MDTNYFHYRNSNLALEKVKVHAEQRLRKHLMKRHKVKDRGIGEGRFLSVDAPPLLTRRSSSS